MFVFLVLLLICQHIIIVSNLSNIRDLLLFLLVVSILLILNTRCLRLELLETMEVQKLTLDSCKHVTSCVMEHLVYYLIYDFMCISNYFESLLLYGLNDV